METVKQIQSLIVVYFVLIVFLLLCVAATPLLIRHGLAVSGHLIIKEEFLETVLIAAILCFSYLILRAYRRTLDAYRRAVSRAGEEKSRLVSRLADAFSYIGSVNVGIKEIQSVVCGWNHYPQTRKEFKQFLQGLTAKVMTATGAPWIVVRIVDLCSGRTIKEFTARGSGVAVPPATIGNRALMEGGHCRSLGYAMKSKPMQSIFGWQVFILLVFLALTFANEVLDLPYLVFGDQPTTWSQRSGEIFIEIFIFISVVALEICLFRRLVGRIKILEGFLPICANCKKIRHQDQWEQIENYISKNSLARFSHSLCPDCQAKLYPELFRDL